ENDGTVRNSSGGYAGKIENDGRKDFGIVPAGGQKKIEIYPLSTFDGKYSVRVDAGTILESEPVEYSYIRYFGDAQVSQRDGNLVLTVDVKEDVTGDVIVQWFTENDWEETQFGIEDLELKAGTQEIVLVDPLVAAMESEEYEEYYQRFMEELKKAVEEGFLETLSEEEQELYRKALGMTKEELYYFITGAVHMETILEAPLRIKIAGEYVYVNI
ncbi:MAG: hypothetical protein J6Z22_08465, partial [Lachnospiraceae bacterium]|nr:hypothetical protein [Lachnospiraceae bacterium]